MDDNCNLSKCPSVNLSTLDVSDNRDIMKQQATINVHRSMSLQVQRKPDRNNNSNSSNSRSPRSASSHFELGNLLARAASFDAKFLRQLNEYETSERRLSSASNSSDIISSLECNGLGRSSSIVHLPDRYVQATAAATSRRRSGRTNSSTQSAGTVALDPVPEWSATSLNEAPESDSDMWRHRETDAMLAMKWLRHEIRLLKQQDRALMRTLFELGTVIHQLNGGLHETVSCQTVTSTALSPISEQSTLTSALKWRPHVESDDCIQTSVSHQQPPVEETPPPSVPDLQNRATSMIDVRSRSDSDTDEIKRPVKTGSLTQMTSRASRLFARLIPRNLRSTDECSE